MVLVNVLHNICPLCSLKSWSFMVKKHRSNACYGLTLSRLSIVPAAFQRFRVGRGWMWILWWKMAREISCCAFICIYNVPMYNIYMHIYYHISNSILRYQQPTYMQLHICHAETLLNARRMASTVELVQPFEGVVDVRWHEGRKPWSFRVCNIWNAMRWRCRENCNCNWVGWGFKWSLLRSYMN